MRLYLLLGVLSVLVMGGLVALVLLSGETRPAPADATRPAGPEKAPPQKVPPRFRPELVQYALGDEKKREALLSAAGPDADDKKILEFGQEFHDKWYQDRERLGRERHHDMEKLWFEGRRPRGEPKAIDKLEKLLEQYPDTNRAGCAAYELGQHYLKDARLPLAERRQKAEQYFRLTDERYDDTLCEFNQPAASMSRLALATWVYRYTDRALARRMLEEVIEREKGHTDHLGQPLDQVARKLLEQIK